MGVLRLGKQRSAALLAALTLTALTACGGSASDEDFAKAAGDDVVQADVDSSTAAPDSVTTPNEGTGPAVAPPVDGGAAPAATPTVGGADAGTGTKPNASSGSGGGAQVGTKPDTSEVKDTSPINLGSFCNCSGPAGSSQGPPLDALRAWVGSVNAKGGVNGHKINLTVVDDRSDPSRARAAVQDMVENKGVVAIVSPFATLTHASVGQYLKEKRVPLIGGEHASIHYTTNPMYFPTSTAQDGWAWGALKVMAQQYKERKLGVLYCVEAEVCSAVNSAAKTYAASLGFNLVYSGQASIAAPDFSAQCLAARSAGVDALLIAMDFNSMRRIAPQCDRQGFKPKYGGMQQDATFLQLPQYTGFPYGNHVFPYSYAGPEAAEFRAALARFVANGANGPFYANAWVGAKFVEKAISGVKGPVTSAALLEQLWTFKNFTAGGLTIPMTYTKDKPTVPPFCVFLTVVGSGKIDAPLGLKPLCKS